MPSATRLCRALVRLYPRQWRDRYGAEVLALIEESRPTWKQAFDLLRGCADAWVQTGLHPAHERTPWTAFAMNFLWAFLGGVLVRVVANTAITFGWNSPESWRYAQILIFLHYALVTLWGAFPLNSKGFSLRTVWILNVLTLTLAVASDLFATDEIIPLAPILAFSTFSSVQTDSAAARQARLQQRSKEAVRMTHV